MGLSGTHLPRTCRLLSTQLPVLAWINDELMGSLWVSGFLNGTSCLRGSSTRRGSLPDRDGVRSAVARAAVDV